MKKLLRNGSVLALLLSLSVGLSACGSKEASAPAQTGTEKTVETTEAKPAVEETTIAEETTEAEPEVEYNLMTTFSYEDTKVDFLNMTVEQWIKLLHKMKVFIDSDDVDMSIRLAPYEAFKDACLLFQYECYNPTGEEIYLKDAKFSFLELRTEMDENFDKLGIFGGNSKLGDTFSTIRTMQEKIFGEKLKLSTEVILDDGRELVITFRTYSKPEKDENGYEVIDGERPFEFIRFEVETLYE